MLLHPKGSKKKIVIIAAGVLVVIGILIATAFWLKGSVETNASSSIKKSHTDVDGALKTLNKKLADTKLSSTDRIKAFTSLEDSVGKINKELCSSESKNVMFNLSDAKKQCGETHKKLSAIETSLQKIQERVKDDQSLAQVLAPVKSADVKDPAKQLEAWTTVVNSAAKATVSQDGVGFKSHLLAAAISYRDAWKELVEADKAQNKANYDAAIKKIDTAKDELAKVAGEQTTAFKKSLVEFKQSVSVFK